MKRIFSFAALSVLLLTVLIGCGDGASEYYDSCFFGMDTYITLRFARESAEGTALSDEYLEKTAAECASLLNRLDLLLSAHNPSSELYALNQNVDVMTNVDEELLSVLDVAFNICDLTGGAYDPTLGGLCELWNITGGGPVPEDGKIIEALLHAGTDKLVVNGDSVYKTDPLTKIDLGGVGKGYATQALLEYLTTTDVPYGLVSLGGNVGVFGSKENGETYKIGVRDPNDASGVVGYTYISSGFLSVSGDYERYFEEGDQRYHHIFDPVTGYPADSGLRSVACFASNGAGADALSTALFVMGVEKGLELYEKGVFPFEAIFITDDNEIVLTDGLAQSGAFERTNERYVVRGDAENG